MNELANYQFPLPSSLILSLEFVYRALLSQLQNSRVKKTVFLIGSILLYRWASKSKPQKGDAGSSDY